MRSYKVGIITIWAVAVCTLTAFLAAGVAGAGTLILAASAGVALACLAVIGVVLLQTAAALEAVCTSLESPDAPPPARRQRMLLNPLNQAMHRFLQLRTETQRKLRDHGSEVALRLQLLERQKKNAEAIIYSIRDSVLVTDACDRIVLANTAAETLFEFACTRDEARPLDQVIDHPEFVNLIRRSRQSRIPHVRHEITFGDARRLRTFDCILSCVEDEKNVPCGIVAVLHDVTREKEISQMKNDFVSHVSHELKTPLASINAYAEMLVDGEAGDAETMQRFCTIIQTQAQRLNRLIEDILNISRIESGLIKVAKAPCSLAILAQSAAEMIKSYAMEKNITVNTPAPIIHDQALGDKDMLTQVIINLLSNAVKYTPAGGTIDISLEVDDADRQVRLTVADTGVGIPPEDLPYVFDKFYRVEANKKQAKGTGLGLNLVKQIVETVHGGRVFVNSAPGQGSTFGFTLPLAAECVAQNV
ncbi:MAG: PAS domain-containing protein [Phycisphaerae bacterium]|nr:PAS domain-containing protein [Phycisphaerae bacterium]